ncbi:ATP-dependent zinc protease [Paraferrimonas sp. SM1919]|uniref:ATP-dependent zinc protease family protein n=1 Tax=Paraferrimonas sp. SM1919 TaxID=2662263 RepID=UPI0013D86FBA|nr:ATP-dependent zinc protease [Paraferrimonas sp. SM1919]
MIRTILALLSLSFVSACSITSTTPGVTQKQLKSALDKQQQLIASQIAEQCTPPKLVTGLQQQVQALGQSLQQIDDKKLTMQMAQTMPKCPETPSMQDKMILGAIENAYLSTFKTQLVARIDTGAESSSLDAREIQNFERDGDDWVRFTLINGQQPIVHEAKVVRFVNIRQSATNNADRRPVIHAHLQIGSYGQTTEINLTDRSHLDYPLLLGRKFIKDIAIVDVSKELFQGEPTKPISRQKDN